MRTYHGRAFRTRGDGSIELEGVWAGVQAIALLLAAALALLLLARNRVLLFPGAAFGLYLLVLPTRRRVFFDRAKRELVVEHAGPWQERWTLRVPFEELRAVYLESAGRRAGRAMHRLMARTGSREIYLLSVFQGEVEGGLGASIDELLARG
jgi:hypothetical protein